MSTAATDEPVPDTARPTGRRRVRAILSTMLPVLLIDVAAPLAVYQLLTHTGTSEVIALTWSALPSALSVGWQAWRSKRLNGIGIFVLASIAVGIGMALIDGDPHLAVARDAGPNLVVAVLLAGSLVIGKRPLLYHAACVFGETYRPDMRELMAGWWTDAWFRRTLRRATAVNAGLLVVESGVRIVLGQVLPIAVAMPVLQVASILLWVTMILVLRQAIVGAARRPAAAGRPVPGNAGPGAPASVATAH